MRTITPWISSVLLSSVRDYPITLPAPPSEKIAILETIYDVRKVRISDGEQVKEGYFTLEVLRQFQQTFGELYVSEVPKYYVSVQTSLVRIEVNGSREHVIKLTRVDLLEKMPKKEEIPDALGCYLRSNGKGTAKEPANGTTVTVPSPPENITFKSDGMNLIKRVVSNLASPDKVVARPEILLDRMKSRMGAALTAVAQNKKSDAEHDRTWASVVTSKEAPLNSSPARDASPAKAEVPTKNLRSSASTRKGSLRSGKTYGEKEAGSNLEDSAKLRKRKREDDDAAKTVPDKRPKGATAQGHPVGRKSGKGNVSVGTEPGTSGLQQKKIIAKRVGKGNEEIKLKTLSEPESPSSTECIPPSPSPVPGTFAANKKALLLFIKAEPKDDPHAKNSPPKKPSVTFAADDKNLVFSQERSSDQPRMQGRPSDVSRASSAWNISPPLLETMKNFVHKHFAMWNR
ncbi:uncharacterized protein LOC135389035 [Ornithodoros turicata]|uniref:uncharacterized protein LOC135389035 n=1 Tax=Ornithodoros turicata TaxID=34597 RepID=UPI00313967A0